MIYVMSDIHGNRRRFDSIMNQIDLKTDDQLYVLGDVIDRHPDGIQILLQLMDMSNATLLLGNHELMMLEALSTSARFRPGEERKKKRLWFSNGGQVTLTGFEAQEEATRYRILEYLKRLPYQLVIDVGKTHYLLVHAAPAELLKYSWSYNDPREFCVWERIGSSIKMPEGYEVIFGHTPSAYFYEMDWFINSVPESERIISIWHGDHRIDIDCGSGFPDTFNPMYGAKGRLACLRLDDMKEFYSEENYD